MRLRLKQPFNSCWRLFEPFEFSGNRPRSFLLERALTRDTSLIGLVENVLYAFKLVEIHASQRLCKMPRELLCCFCHASSSWKLLLANVVINPGVKRAKLTILGD